MPVLGSKVITQVSIVVKDVEKAARDWAALLGIPVPQIVESGTLEDAHTQYRGEPSVARAKLAFFKLGDQVEMEIIEPDEHPSTWREVLDKKGEGIHHIAFHIKGMDENTKVLESHGLTCVQKGEYIGGKYAYFDAPDNPFKLEFELLEND